MTRDIRTFNGFMDLKTCLYFLSAIILAVALSLVYHARQNQSDSALPHTGSTAMARPVMSERSKRYSETLEQYGDRHPCSQAGSVLASSRCDVGNSSSWP
jgi:hypothetical protein